MAHNAHGGTIASSLGSAFGTGISDVLDNLANRKANQLQEREATQRWQALGLDPQKAKAIASMPMQMQQQVLNEILPSFQVSQQGQQPAMQQMQGQNQRPMQQMQSNQQQPMQQQQVTAPLTKSQQKQAIEERKLTHQQKKEDLKQQQHIDKETSKFYKETLASAKSADNNDRRLNRMDTLIKRGNLSNPAFHSLLNTLEKGIFGFGINLHSLENPDSQEFNKISKEFLKDAKETFGNRLTNLDVDTFLKMVPDLTQSDEGKKRIINNMKAYNEANRIRKNTMEEIIKSNGGRRPANLESLVEELAGPKLDELAREFKQGYGSNSKPEPTESEAALQNASEPASVLDQIRKLIGLV